MPSAVPPVAAGNLTDDVVRRVAEDPDGVAFGVRTADGWRDVTIGAFHEEVTAAAKGLVAAGIEPGDHVALMSRTRYEWTVLDYAIWFAGAVTVPIYATSPVEHVAEILRDSGAAAAWSSTRAMPPGSARRDPGRLGSGASRRAPSTT